ncbi:MAG: hypothetical protein RLZZ592_2718 [Pseudomonadota bacterium]
MKHAPLSPVPAAPCRARSAALLLGVMLLLTQPQEAPAWTETTDAAPARVERVDGALRLQRADGGRQDFDGQRLERRAPLHEGDRLRSGADARADLAFGSDRLRLDENTVLTVRRLDERRIEIELEQGSIALLLGGREQALRWRIETAAAMHRPQGPGKFRIDAPVSSRWLDGAAATAWRSPMHLESASDSLLLQPGQRAEPGRQGWQIGLPVADRFARWAMADGTESVDREPRNAARAIVSGPVVLPDDLEGADQLERNGRWEHSPDWGWVWVPRASLSWEPFRQGSWRRGDGGWLWLDDAPWGVATYRHGRWLRWDGRWAWMPGPAVRHVEPVAPLYEAPPRVIVRPSTPPVRRIEPMPAPAVIVPPRVVVQPATPPVIIETRPAAPVAPPVTGVRPAPPRPDRRAHEAPQPIPTPATPADPAEDLRRSRRAL